MRSRNEVKSVGNSKAGPAHVPPDERVGQNASIRQTAAEGSRAAPACYKSTTAWTICRASRAPGDDTGRGGKAFQRLDALLQPPAIFGRPVLEARVDAEVVRPM